MNNDHTFKLMRKCVILLLLFATQETFSQTKIFNSSNDSVKALVITYDITYPNGIPSNLKSVCNDKAVAFIYLNNFVMFSYGGNSDKRITMSDDYGANSYFLFPNLQLMLKINRNDLIKNSGGSLS